MVDYSYHISYYLYFAIYNLISSSFHDFYFIAIVCILIHFGVEESSLSFVVLFLLSVDVEVVLVFFVNEVAHRHDLVDHVLAEQTVLHVFQNVALLFDEQQRVRDFVLQGYLRVVVLVAQESVFHLLVRFLGVKSCVLLEKPFFRDFNYFLVH